MQHYFLWSVVLYALVGWCEGYEWLPVAVTSSVNPAPRRDAALVAVPNTKDVYLFGGRSDDGTIFNDLWRFRHDYTTGSSSVEGSWTQLAPPTAPPGRFSLVYGHYSSGSKDYIVIATGEAADKKILRDVWRYSVTDNEWEELADSGEVPRARYGAGGGILPGTSTLAVTHGFDGADRFDDTFQYDLSAETWMRVAVPSGPIPYPRCLVAGAVSLESRLTIYSGCGSGGYGPCGGPDGGTMDLLTTPSWQVLEDACFGPRLYGAMAPHPPTGQVTDAVIVFGGSGGVFGSGEAGEIGVWELATNAFTRLNVGAIDGSEGPLPRIGPAMSYAQLSVTPSSDDVVVLFGGETGNGVTSKLWMLNVGASFDGMKLDCPYYVNLRMIHGILMFMAWSVILPFGVFVARYCRGNKPPRWFKIHRAFQSLGVVVALAGFAVAMMINTAGKFGTIHGVFGLIITFLGFQQPINACFRPEPAWKKTKRRVCWEYYHKYSGRVAIFLGLINPILGLQMVYVATQPRHDAAGFGALPIVYLVFALLWAAAFLSPLFLGLPGPENPSPLAEWFHKKCPNRWGTRARAKAQAVKKDEATVTATAADGTTHVEPLRDVEMVEEKP